MLIASKPNKDESTSTVLYALCEKEKGDVLCETYNILAGRSMNGIIKSRVSSPVSWLVRVRVKDLRINRVVWSY